MAELDSIPRDDIIKCNLEAFLPYICDCVRATDLLVHLHYFTREQRKEIFQLYGQNGTAATRRAMEVLLHESNDVGRYVAVRDAIEISGYPNIVLMLDGESVPSDENCRKILELFTREIERSLNPVELLPHLMSQGTIDMTDAEEVRAEERNHGMQRACWVLLFHLPNRVENWFKNFMEALIDCNFSDIAEMLDPDLFTKIMAQRQAVFKESRSSGCSCGDVQETIQTGNNFDSIIEKEDFEPLEKNTECTSTANNIDTHDKMLTDKSCIVSLLTGTETMMLNSDTAFKQLATEDVTEGSSRTNNNADTDASLTEEKVLAQNLVCKIRKNGRIQYDRQFLLACKDAPLTKLFPKEVEKFPDIMIPLTLPRRPDTEKRKKSLAPPVNISSVEVWNRQLEYTTNTIFENDFELEADNKSDDHDLQELPDFDELLANSPVIGHQRDSNGVVGKGSCEVQQQEDNVTTVIDSPHDSLEELARDFEGVVGGQDVIEGAIGGQEDDSTVVEIYRRKKNDSTDRKIPYNINRMDVEGMLLAMVVNEELNDLNIEGRLISSEEFEFNIPTDADTIEDIEDKDVDLREYQKELAKEGTEGENVIVMAPTNTGKTRVACSIMQAHLRKQKQSGMIGKVIFLVENEALAFQQGRVCAEQLAAYRTKVISGSVQRDKKQFLRDFIDRRDILVVTAQVLLNALKLKEIESLTTFSMIVFDECHHTDNMHRFNEIMGWYMHLKLRQDMDNASLPQIIGLTASLGVGGTTVHELAMCHMKGLLANLDAKFLCTVRRNKEELRHYENNPKEEIVCAQKRVDDRYRQAILEILEIIDQYMLNHPSMTDLPKQDAFIIKACRIPASCGSAQFLQWLSEFNEALGRLSSDGVRRMMYPCRIHLEVYNKALLIHADARIKDAEAILETFMEDEKTIASQNDTDIMLLELYAGLKRKDIRDEPENPKLVKMKKLVMDVLGNNEDARGIIFVKTRELAEALVHWMSETEQLTTLNASEFVGQAASKAQGGMTKCGQKDVLEYFKDGRNKIIIATSVAEEGLDITKCNLVIRYEHVTNEIVRLQSRGRARAPDSRYYVLTEEGSWIVAKEEKNALLEKVMNRIVLELQIYIEDHQNIWEREIRQMQKLQMDREELRKEQRIANMTDDVKEIRCPKCNNFVCFSSDIRKIQDSHHVVIDEDVQKRIISVRSPHPSFMEEELKFDGAIFCGNVECQRVLGGVCEYRHVEFPLIAITNIRVVDKNGKGRTFKKWKKANFEPEKFTLDDLRCIVERRRETSMYCVQ